MKFNCAYDELVELHKLTENPKNPNKHPDKQIERLAKIIDYQGQRAPIVVSTRSGFITKGHGRLLALKKLGWEKAAVDYQDYDSDAQEYADIVSDNKIAAWAEFDMAMVNADIADLGPELDIELLGMENFTVDVSEKIPLGDVELDTNKNKRTWFYDKIDAHIERIAQTIDYEEEYYQKVEAAQKKIIESIEAL